MASTYSALLRLTYPTTGDLAGTWGAVLNAGTTALIEDALAGVATLVMADANYTLSSNNGVSDEARKAVVSATGTLTASRNVVVPALTKIYLFENATTGGFSVTVKTPSGTGVSVPNGSCYMLRCDGTNVVAAFTSYPISGIQDFTSASSVLLPAATTIGTTTAAELGYVHNVTSPIQTQLNAKANLTGGNTVTGAQDMTGATLTVPTRTAGDSTQNAASTAFVAAGLALKVGAAGPNSFTGTQDFTGGSITVPTRAIGDNSANAASTAFVAATAFSPALPGQTGNAGKFVTTDGTNASWASPLPSQTGNAGKYVTTDGTNASWGSLSVVGTGGTTSTGSITLTASSPAAMTITPATPGLYVTLPDATTCTKADNLYSVYNAGDFDYGVKDSAGTQLGWIRPKTGAMIGLSDSSTAAGVWAYYGLEKIGSTALYVHTTLANMGSTIKRISLDANRTCFLFGDTDCYSIIYDASTQTWGSPTLVRSSVKTSGNGYIGTLSTSNQVLVVTCDSTTALEAVTLTTSGTTITVNTGTKASTTLSGNLSSMNHLLSVSAQSAFAFVYGRTSTVAAIRSITVSGTTPAISAEATLPTGSVNTVCAFVSGSIVRTVCSDASTIYCKPFTFSGGSTPSGGTQASAAATSVAFRAFLNGNGNIVCHYINTTHYATIFKLTGTTEAASSVSLGTAPASIPTNADYVAVSASKTAFFAYSATTQMHCNILTDTAGTASAGTQVTVSAIYGATASSPVGLFASSGNNARFMYSVATGSYQCRAQVTFDCSGASPVLSSTYAFAGKSSSNGGVTATETAASNVYGARDSSHLYSGPSTYFVGGDGFGADVLATQNSVSRIKGGIVSFAGVGNSGGTPGANTNETWSAYPFSPSSTGFTIQRVECAA